MPPRILIYRDRRESRLKCSLSAIRGLPGVEFARYVPGRRFSAGACVLLHPDGPELSRADLRRDLLLVDCSWRHLPQLLASLDGEPAPRSLPRLVTAYPRKSKVFDDPDAGLASIEALFAATVILGEPRPELLIGYRYAEQFLSANPSLSAYHAGSRAP